MNYCTSTICCGLGNVLFQVATGLSYSIDNNKKYAIFNNSFGSTTHVNNQYYFGNILKNIKRINKNYNNFKRINEHSDFYYRKIEKNSTDNILLDGFFLSHKYFADNSDYIRNTFSLDSYCFDSKTCSVHVRRGDYFSLPNMYEILEMDYYEQAMSRMPNDVKFLIFSNDIRWCIKNFRKFKNVKFIHETDPYKSMSMMASCDYHIVANSTFSWWGAYLAKDSKKVIAPYKWFKKEFFESRTKLNYGFFLKKKFPRNWEIL